MINREGQIIPSLFEVKMMSVGTVISYPIPLYQNLPIEPQFYKPSRFVISNISLGYTTIVTTSVDHNYSIGQQVRLIIPSSFGCYQLNEASGYVISIPSSTQVEITINSSKNVNPFFASSSTQVLPQILSIGDLNSGQNNLNATFSNINFITGSFQNISPL